MLKDGAINRRSILRFLGLAPVAAVACTVLPSATRIDASGPRTVDANVGEISTRVMCRDDGKFRIDLANATITIEGFTDDVGAA